MWEWTVSSSQWAVGSLQYPVNSTRLLFYCSLFTVYCSLLLFTIQPAHAHAQLVAAEPANGTTLTESPAEIHLTFNENLGADSEVAIIGRNFERVLGVEIREIVFNEVFVDVPELAAGVYTVQYDVVSADNHPISGSYEFAVEPPPDRPSLLTGAIFGSVITLIGVVMLVVWRQRVAS